VYHQSLKKFLIVLAVFACSKREDKQSSSAADPWANPSASAPATAAAADPWANPSAAAPAAPPAAAGDPWANPSAPEAAVADDPWAENAASEQPTPASANDPPPQPQAPRAPRARSAQAVGAASTLAGNYQCQQLRHGTSVNGIRQSTYVSSALGVFEIDADGVYRSASYPTKGTGRVRMNGSTVTFDDGPYPGSIGMVGTTSSGSFHIRFHKNLTEAPEPNLRFNDHMCYRK
jgi:hypothetical protein